MNTRMNASGIASDFELTHCAHLHQEIALLKVYCLGLPRIVTSRSWKIDEEECLGFGYLLFGVRT